MQKKKLATSIANWLRYNRSRESLDESAKQLLSNLVVLAWILKYSVEEFSEYDIEEIEDMIEGEPDISKIRLEPGLSVIPLLHRFQKEKIDGLPTENHVREEGTIYFDILFYVRLPKEDELMKMIINVEAQNQFLLSLVPRGFFYCARMVSRQMRREFRPPNYGDIKKVKSIWLCFDPPDYAKGTITSFRTTQKNIYGNMPENKFRSDIMEVILVCLDKEAYEKDNENPLGSMLSTMLSDKLNYEEKSQRLSEDYGIQMNEQMGKEMEFMCNYSEYILEQGHQAGLQEGHQAGLQEGQCREVFSSVQEGDYGVERGAQKLQLSVAEFEKKMQEAGYKIPEIAE